MALSVRHEAMLTGIERSLRAIRLLEECADLLNYSDYQPELLSIAERLSKNLIERFEREAS